MDRQSPDLGSSTTTLSWVADLETDPASFAPVDQTSNEAAYSVADDISMSGRSDGTPGTGIIRLFVRLPNGARMLVPISQTATVGELHGEAVRRASILGETASVQASVIETTGQNASILFEEDAISDVLDTTENLTFLLNPLDISLRQASTFAAVTSPQTVEPTAPSPPTSSTLPIQVSESPWSTSVGKATTVYIRWITPRTAMDATYLKNVPVESYQTDGKISVADLNTMAFDQIYGKYNIGKEDPPAGVHLELFLSHCYLSAVSGNYLTVTDLAPEGTSRKEPINIFVSSVRKPEHAARIQENWGFECTDRSVATFMTSLEVMIHEITKNRLKLSCLLDVLWSITHFPPALLAFKQLYDNVLPSSGKFDASQTRALCVLVETFREIAQKMVPPWISNTPDALLESSRQVFAWLHTLSTQADLSHEDVLTLVYEVELQDVTNRNNVDEIMGLFKCKELVEIDSADGPHKRFLVSLISLSHISPKVLAMALNGSEEYPCNYYFYLPDNSAGLLGHKRASCLHPADFDNLLETTNQVSGFKMIGPLQLANCTSSELPIVTLDSAGFVSAYNQKVELCADGSYYTWNTIKGREEMSETNPGQYLLQKLNPIMIQRKKDKNWEIDAWSEAEATNDMGNPDEAIVICVDASGSMGTEMATGWMENQSAPGSMLLQNQISRLTEVKDVFRNLVSRISAYNLPTHLGLVTFSSSSRVLVSQPLTPVLLNFQHRLDGTSASGPTAVFDALHKARGMLVDLKAKHPSMKCRIIVLTDGEDNSSSVSPATICRELYSADIVVDAIVIGTNATLDLFKIAKHTGGYAFCPKTRSALFQIFLLETFIDLKTRPDIIKPVLIDYSTTLPKAADMQTPFDFPPCRPHANQHDYFISLRDADRFLTNLSRGSSNIATSSCYAASEATTRSGSTWTTVNTGFTGTTMGVSGGSRLILNEVKSMIENQHEYIDVYVSESNMGFWKVVMQGPPVSSYEDGTFLLYIEFGDQFPRKAPTARFITPILHPNITKHGRICHPIFDREWTPVTRVYQVIQQLWGIFMSLEARDAIDPLFTLKFWTDPEAGRREVKEYVRRFATPNRATHRSNILSGASSTPSISSIAPPPSYRTTATSPQASGLATHLSTLRRPVVNSTVGSGTTVFTPPSTASGQSTPTMQSRRSSILGSTDGLLSVENEDTASVTSSNSNGRRQRFFSKFHRR